MLHSFSSSPLRSMEISPSYSSSHIPFGDASSAAVPFDWRRSTYPTTPCTPDTPGLYATDGFGHGGEDGYFEDEIGWRTRRDGEWNDPMHLKDASGDRGSRSRNGNSFLEHCRSEHCFFGCGGSCVPLAEYAAECDRDMHTSTREYEFDVPRSSYLDNWNAHSVEKSYRIERENSAVRSASFVPCSPWTSPMYHGRRASVPSSPSSLHPSRHRRLSEPFNTPSSPRSIRSLDPHISGSGPANDNHLVPAKVKDQTKPILFKTELCRSWEEKGSCRYGNKCQFAHSQGELRPVPRHPKYKTQFCKTFLEAGSCNYGSRCCFMHSTSRNLTNPKSSPLHPPSVPEESFP